MLVNREGKRAWREGSGLEKKGMKIHHIQGQIPYGKYDLYAYLNCTNKLNLK